MALVAKVTEFGPYAGEENTLYARWSWDESKRSTTSQYEIWWDYKVPGIADYIFGEHTTIDYAYSESRNFYKFTYDEKAERVRFWVRPISQTYGNNIKYWTANWSSTAVCNIQSEIVPQCPTPTFYQGKGPGQGGNVTFSVKWGKEDAYVDGKLIADWVFFKVITTYSADETYYNYYGKTGDAELFTGWAKYGYSETLWSCTLNPGYEYKVVAWLYNSTYKLYGEKSEESERFHTSPGTPSDFEYIRADENNAVQLQWDTAWGCESYTLQYTKDSKYFKGNTDASTHPESITEVSNIEFRTYELTGLDLGYTYFFRVRAVNDIGVSTWSNVGSLVLGEKPSPPTTWSNKTVITNENSENNKISYFWVHNTSDNSLLKESEIEYTSIDGTQVTETIASQTPSTEKSDIIQQLDKSPADYVSDTEITWRVRTKGLKDEWSDWSITRTINVYNTPTLTINLKNSADEYIQPGIPLTGFPLKINLLANCDTQTVIGYYITIVSENDYETIDLKGNTVYISKGDEVYYKYFNESFSGDKLVTLGPNDVSLENNITYKVQAGISTDSGLTAENSNSFTVEWDTSGGTIYGLTAQIGIDSETLQAYISPIAYSDEELTELSDFALISVFRREFDGSFTEIASDLKANINVFVTDPHPALDIARYRLVATNENTGEMEFTDIHEVVDEKSIVIQWDEVWSDYILSDDGPIEGKPWSGSMIKIPWNIDTSDSNSPDVSFIDYIGRKRPVSYYGTHLNEASSWSCNIQADDLETLYSLRRLAVWMGDAYVREPSGTGYWANVKVSLSKTHNELVIPVSFDITRVEGGI